MSVIEIGSHVLNAYHIDAKARNVINAATSLIVGLVKGKTCPIPESKFKRIVNTLIKNYDKQLVVMNSLGMAFSIICLLDSNNDRKEVRRFQGELISTFKNYPPNLWEQRLAEIRVGVENLKTRQWSTGVAKFLMSVSFGCLTYASPAHSLLQAGSAICSVTSGAAAIMNGVNYYNLHELTERLKKDGRLN
ncbi:unnamed protein product [Adineta steineri]|uniref:Uncharacterized protein n=1 Tax=Adineta steineri TaxID=433720 RepID=A0A815TQR8_9BILA|nr:unnamed protein product [Adineta steineri]CAF3766627.1 unnamed protein product [Adineta steineri]